MSQDKGEVTLLLERVGKGDSTAEEALMQQVYVELHRIASARLRSERAEHTLQPTALVHEAYIRLCGNGSVNFNDSTHFFRIAARLMRRILVDYARQKNAGKRPDRRLAVSLDDAIDLASDQCSNALEVNSLLDRLAELSPRQAQVVELRYFGGLTEEEVAVAVERNVRTVRRDWNIARAWFRKQMTGPNAGHAV
jgi:RNA polymerase sigma factor (TIGR02999 family)